MKAETAIADDLDHVRWKRLYVRKMESETVESFKLFRAHGIEPLLIKGWGIARMYPSDRLRYYGDVDLAVDERDHQTAFDLKNSAEGVRLSIDLHRGLRHLDAREWHLTFADSREFLLDDVPIRVPSEEDHLRILAAHWLNDGGEDKEKLWDVYYAVKHRSAEFDWDKCLGVVEPARRSWVITVIGLAHRSLGLPIDDLPFKEQAERLPGWLVRTVEKAWNSNTKLRSLPMSSEMRGEFFVQLKKRIPPNPIQATIEAEGDLFGRARRLYQIKSIRRRLLPSIKNLVIMSAKRVRK